MSAPVTSQQVHLRQRRPLSSDAAATFAGSSDASALGPLVTASASTTAPATTTITSRNPSPSMTAVQKPTRHAQSDQPIPWSTQAAWFVLGALGAAILFYLTARDLAKDEWERMEREGKGWEWDFSLW